MDKYDGMDPDLHSGGMKWDDPNAAKHGGPLGCGEKWNFKVGGDGIVRGFVMLTSKNSQGKYSGTINIDRLGANREDHSIDGVFVVFYGPKKGSNENFVIGWYENARVYREWTLGGAENDYRRNPPYTQNEPYSFEVKDRYFLIPSDRRTIPVISAGRAKKEGYAGSYPGQACVFFGSSNEKYVDLLVRQLTSERDMLTA